MTPIGDGFLGSLGHKHFLKVFIGFAIIVAIVLIAYQLWIKKQISIELEKEQLQNYQAQQDIQ